MANPNKRNKSRGINEEMLTIEIEKMINEGGLGAEKYYDLQKAAQKQNKHNN